MYTYTMTFVDQDGLIFPDDTSIYRRQIEEMVERKLESREFTLADFNWSGNYDPEHTKAYLVAPYQCHAVVEIRLRLNMTLLNDRNAIYDHCLAALKQKTIYMRQIKEFHSDHSQKAKQLLCFDMFH